MAPKRAMRNGRNARISRHAAPFPVEDDGVPQIFKEMLDEETGDVGDVAYRGAKRRKVGERVVKFEDESDRNDHVLKAASTNQQYRPQIIQDLERDSEEADDDDFEWEEVDTFGASTAIDSDAKVEDDQPLSIVIGNSNAVPVTPKRRIRKPVTATEKQIRLDVHKTHLLCLLYHGWLRNHWCNDEAVQRIMRKLLKVSPKLIQKLHPEVPASQFQRSNWLTEAMKEICDVWRAMFSITSLGQKRATWNVEEESNDVFESFLNINEFRNKVSSLFGSADYGAQLFCALLRGLDVEARLICSLQPLPFATSAATVSPARAPTIPTVYALSSEDEHSLSASDSSSPKVKRIARLGSRKNRNGNSLGVAPSVSLRRPSSVLRPRHPVFWVEVFDKSYQTWIAIDPMATGNIGKPHSLEPGMNDPDNLMSYVIAYEDDRTARDVTRRYTKAYNAKTRKLRVDCTDGGIKWYRHALRMFRRQRKLERDMIEDGHFMQRDMQEGMPRNVEDFRGHPVYVLERHLYRDEALHPKREVGKVGQSAKSAHISNLESVYRRQDVHHVKSADKWFRLGRKLKDGEQPLKLVKARKRQEVFDEIDGPATAAPGELGLYAYFQTELYVPPPVTSDGLLPRNEFGNIDVYAQSMIPAGTVHIKSEYARQTARILGIDYVDAVTGFNFRGRHGTAVVNGVVVAAIFRDAMVATLESMAYMHEHEEVIARRERSLMLWRKFVLGLRIVESVNQYKREDESSDDNGSDSEYVEEIDVQQELETEMIKHDGHTLQAGPTSMMPKVGKFEVIESVHRLPDPPAVAATPVSEQVETSSHNEGGGFLIEGAVAPSEAGGFMVEESQAAQEVTALISDPDRCLGKEEPAPKISQINGHPRPRERNATSDEPLPGSSSNIVLDMAEAAKLANALDSDNDMLPELNDEKALEDAERQSLLSHDPDEDDQDPEWLD